MIVIPKTAVKLSASDNTGLRRPTFTDRFRRRHKIHPECEQLRPVKSTPITTTSDGHNNDEEQNETSKKDTEVEIETVKEKKKSLFAKIKLAVSTDKVFRKRSRSKFYVKACNRVSDLSSPPYMHGDCGDCVLEDISDDNDDDDENDTTPINDAVQEMPSRHFEQ